MGEISESSEKERPFIGAEPFGFTEHDVLEAIEAIRKDIDDFTGALDSRRVAERALPIKKRNLQALTRLSPEEILATIKNCYDRIVELANSGLPNKEIITRIRMEFPDIIDYYPILRKKGWGYRLGQAVIDAATENEK